MQTLFPYETIRTEQAKMMEDVYAAIKLGKNILTHAPTGLGKTASVLSVAVPYAQKHGYTVFFLTNRHTQHQIAVETLHSMKKKHNVHISVVDMIGKKWMCAHEHVGVLAQSEFVEYCKSLREHHKCEFYTKLYRKDSGELSFNAHRVQVDIKERGPFHVHQVKNVCIEKRICPYYFSSESAKEADVIIADYFTLFHPIVQATFFARAGKELEKSIVIVDEGHNLPGRIRSVMSRRLSSFMIKSALREAKKYRYHGAIEWLQQMQLVLVGLAGKKEQVIVNTSDFVTGMERVIDYETLLSELDVMGDEVRDATNRSFLGSIGEFCAAWNQQEKGFVRYVEQKAVHGEQSITLYYSCLDAAAIAKPLFERVHSSVIMSGTLLPLEMFRNVLGVSRAVVKSYGNPFPAENKLSLVVPVTTTAYSLRSSAMFERIAAMCSEIISVVPGNCAFFFPSYYLRDNVVQFVSADNVLLEKPSMNTFEKKQLLDQFKERKDEGVALFGVAAANFAEGVDLPGDLLKAVVVVGLPLAKPDVPTHALIRYFDRQFKKGWEYGYTNPAMMKCLQAAGRCIRTENDRGVVIFIDTRFIQPRYFQCIPSSWNVDVTRDFGGKVREFFKQ
jgi:DNA excision repair protein ERCC-2